ncbi:MAG: methyltransferase domain-containing protein [Bryobacteraceae bacterium]
MPELSGYHDTRLPYDAKREVLWKALCEYYFQPLVPPDACVLELGAGYGHFINNIRCARRIALDQWESFGEYLQPGIVASVGSVTDLSFLEDRSVDFAFASNLFEHLTQSDFAVVLQQLLYKLKPGGTLNIVQPNYRFAYKEYFDDYTHVAVYSHLSLTDFLAAHGFRVIDCQPRFLPLTVKSKLPVWRILIRMYLALPFKPLGKQMLVRAVASA